MVPFLKSVFVDASIAPIMIQLNACHAIQDSTLTNRKIVDHAQMAVLSAQRTLAHLVSLDMC